MHTRAVENPTRISVRGTRKERRCDRLLLPVVPSSFSTELGGIPIAAIMEAKRKIANNTTSVRRILAISLNLRKYLRNVMRAAR